ncbi:MAG: DUF2628 domain-containing protein [Pygmaiobacter massiliensis]|nr:DUF2628 domain-containing protein [Pygmaiobacter massiliensis]
MYQFEGCECPICKKTIVSGDDLVVCPECGAPYHRECYVKHGACLYEDRHAEGFEWQPQQPARPRVACPHCGYACPAGDRYCSHCGAPLVLEQKPPVNGGATPRQVPPDGSERDFSSFLYTQMDLPDQFDGIPLKDWTTYIGPSAPYYLMQFARQDRTGNKLGFIFSAALFGPYYFCYRRVWSMGILALLINVGLNIPGALYYLQAAGTTLPFAISASSLATISWVCSVLWVVVNALWGFSAVWLYRRHSARTMHRWKSQAASEEVYQQRLMAKSGPCKAFLYLLAGLAVLSAVFSFLPFLFI